MFRLFPSDFPNIYATIREMLLSPDEREVVTPGEWHSQPSSVPTYELQNVVFETRMPGSMAAAVNEYEPNIPWAEDHFLERVSGVPLNPPPSSLAWGGIDTKDVVKTHLTAAVIADAHNPTGSKLGFSHTYPERYWPKAVGVKEGGLFNKGVRYWLGDLNDLVQLILRSPLTRQAYLPVWFPEDTGAVHGERVPCTLGYHFLIRSTGLDCTYLIRSCDFVRNFRDDVYLTVRLAQWISEWIEVPPGRLTFHCMSMHCHEPDTRLLEEEIRAES